MANYHCAVVSPWLAVNGVNEMAVALDYPGEWSDITWQADEYILRGLDKFVAQGIITQAQLTTLLADGRYVVLWSHAEGSDAADLNQTQVGALRAKIGTAYSSDVARLATDGKTKPKEIAVQLTDANRRPPWKVGAAVAVGDVYQFSGNLYEVIQAHTTQADWTPNKVPALFKRFYEPTDDPWPWVQPTGAHDAYPVGTRVTHGGYTWRNDIPANVWEPGVTGWTNLTPPPQTSEWKTGVAYKIGDKVTYQGSTYECRQAHTSQAGWTPTAAPALWLKL